jgi:DNA polymerase I-like protein with 3'-5' exonuclease and polymerase domains
MLQGAFDFALPKSNWCPPSSLPNIPNGAILAVDTEGFDPDLETEGPGFLRNKGRVAGVSIAWMERSVYLPIGHEFGDNLDSSIVCGWLCETLGRTNNHVVFANAPYDLGNLRRLGVEVKGAIHDIQIMDPLLDAERSDGYSLNALCKRWLGKEKNEEILRQASTAHGSIGRTKKLRDTVNAKKIMHLLAPRFVGPYAEDDASDTLAIFHKIKEHPEWQEVSKLYDEVEQPLIRTLFEMMWRGVRVDMAYAEELNDRWLKEENELYAEMGFNDIWSGDACIAYLRKHGISIGKSIAKEFLGPINHPAALDLKKARELAKCRKDYLEATLLKGSYRGRIYPQYNQMASDEGGTKTGRLSCKNPNAQQIPKRSKNIDSKAIRKALLPEEGLEWAKFDYWSQEPVILVHYGIILNLPRAKEVGEMFARGVKLYKFIEDNSQGKLNYDEAKEVTLARSYGQQTQGLADKMGMEFEEAERLQQDYDEIVPYIKKLAEGCSTAAGSRGYIKTLLGRKQRFNFWQPVWNNNPEERFLAFRLKEAQKKWPKQQLKRAFLYKALNFLAQGSAADQTKLALVRIHQEVGLPQMTVHDEISKSVQSKKEALHIKEIMETCIKLRVPVRADMDLGPTWQ